jgi:FixJ family two-component response regulator
MLVNTLPRSPALQPESPVVLIVDDDENFREAVTHLLGTVGYESLSYASASELMSARVPDRRGCILLDVRLPGMSGLELHRELSAAGNEMPVIFMTGYGDIPMSVQAMKAGAFDFLVKPFRDQDLIDCLNCAVARDDARKGERRNQSRAIERASHLTPRERQVFELVVSGALNKQIAARLGITETTVKLHRGNLMRKLGVRSVAALVRIYDALGEAELEPKR